MGCNCGKGRSAGGGGVRAGARTASGATVRGYQVTFPDGSTAPTVFLTSQEAWKEARRRGNGATVTQLTA